MKTIILKKLEVRNFKGKHHDVFEFSNNTSLFGDNGTGKTTIGADALPWLFFGKNSADETKFNVKTLDDLGERIPNVETSVKGWFEINGELEVFERVLFEKWVKKHGTTTSEYVGDETKYFINAAPKKKKEYDQEVGNIISSGLFKLLTNPLEFNRLPWEKRREVLVKIGGEVSNDTVLDSVINVTNKADYNALINALNKNGIETYKSELKGKIKLNKNELANIPSRIDEVQRSKPDVLDWSDLNGQIQAKNKRLDEIGKALNNEAKKLSLFNQGQREIQKQIGEKQLELQKVENELKIEANKDLQKSKKAVDEIKADIESLNNAYNTNTKFIETSKIDLDSYSNQREKLLKAYKKIKDSEFVLDESKTICPTCKRELENYHDVVEQFEGNFNQNKSDEMAENIRQGKKVKESIETLKKSIIEAHEAIEDIPEEIKACQSAIKGIDISEKQVDYSMEKEWNDLVEEIEKLKLQIKKSEPVNNEALIAEQHSIEAEIKTIERQLLDKERIAKADERIAELQAYQMKYSQAIADLEKEQSIVLEFEKIKITMVESNVNSKFKLVKFRMFEPQKIRMFEPQKNGGEKPNCVTLINGVPYSDANTASKINAGIDIINVLSEFYGVFAPIIVDNRESVTELLPVKSQLINLIKDSNYKTLTVK